MPAEKDKLSRVWEHSLPYRVLVEELKIRRKDPDPDATEQALTDWENAQREVQRLRNLETPDLEAYRRAQEAGAGAEERLKKLLHDANLSALCFSGGGIRSASFGLGVLMQLARISSPSGALNEIDYVSTVSGGGYVGSWLTGYIRTKSGLQGVIRELSAKPLTSADPEPPPFRHLRDYTSYLAPRTGALSTDTWTLVAIVLRNLLLNWAILVPAFMALLLLPVLNRDFLVWATSQRAGRFEFSAGAVIFALAALGYVACKLPGNCLKTPRKTNFIWPGLWLLISAWCFAGFYLTDTGQYQNDFFFIWLLAFVAHAGLLLGRVLAISRRGNNKVRSWRNFGLQVLVSIPTSLSAATMLWFLHVHVAESLLLAADGDLRLFVSLYVPLIWLAFMLTAVLLDGLSARFEDDQDREWWSRAGAFIMRGALLWTVAHLLVLYAPEILNAGNSVFISGRLPQGATISFLTAVIGTLASWIGFSPATPSGRAKTDTAKLGKLKDLLAKNGLLIPALGGVFFVLLALMLADANSTIWPFVAGKLNVQYAPGLGLLIAAATAIFFNVFVNVNTFSLHAMYRNRLIRSYLGASNNKRKPNPFTNFDANDDFPIKEAPHSSDAPLHVINMALNVVATKNLAWQQRKAESFTASALHCGSFRVGYRPTEQYGDGENGISIGTAMAISGAAASPNMGYHSSPILTLVMTFFNARLGWWLPNPGEPGRSVWRRISPLFSLGPLLNEALGRTNDQNRWVYVSDGGHFENLALYEMVLRRCKRIIVVDGGCDPEFNFEDLGNAVRKIFIDLGVPIDFEPAVALKKGPNSENQHVFLGTIRYSCVDGAGPRMPDGADSNDGHLLYIKASLTGDEPADVTQYYKTHPAFPHESTSNQFFNESQFESYVRLGTHIVQQLAGQSMGSCSLDELFKLAKPKAKGAGA
jgi:hypothetical protein